MMNQTGRKPVAIARPDVILQELGDEVIAANLDTGVYFSLNEVAARIWTLLHEASSIDEVVTMMMSEYEVDESDLRSDIEQLVGELVAHGLIRLNDA